MQMRASMPSIRLDVANFKQGLDKEITRILRLGVIEWVLTAEAHIPNWSGSSRGTLSKLADSVGVSISNFPSPGAPDRRAEGSAGYRSTWRSQDSSEGGFLASFPRYSFFYRVEGHYLIYNEENDANASYGFHLTDPGPYGFLDAADKAFTAKVKTELRRAKLGSVRQLIKIGTQRISRG